MATDRPMTALRTPLYLIMAAFGLLIAASTFLPWATVDPGDAALADGVERQVTGLDAGGWGPATIVAGLAIAIIGVIGYFWNPFSDPEALFIAGFSVATGIAAIAKLGDSDNLVNLAIGDYYPATAGYGLWVIVIAAAFCLVGAAWIVVSRPGAELRLSD